MATFTSAGVNNLWSNNANWDVPPSDGSTWTIPVGQTCEFDIDMATLGYTGMGAGTINGELKASTTTGSYVLKQGANITMGSAGIFRAGSSGSRYPADCSFHLMFTGAYRITCGGDGNIQFWCKEPTNKWALIVPSGNIFPITGATQADPCEITCVGHPFATSDNVYLTGLGGMTELNDLRVRIVDTGADTFTLRYVDPNLSLDSTGFTSYTSGGYAIQYTAEATPVAEIHIDRDLSADTDWPVNGRVRVDACARATYNTEPASSTPYTIASKSSDSITINTALTATKAGGSLLILVSRNVRISGVTGTGYVINGNTTGGHQFDVEISDCSTTGASVYYGSTQAVPSSFTAGCLANYSSTPGAGPKAFYACHGLVMNGGVTSGYDFAIYYCNYVSFSAGSISGSYGAIYGSYYATMSGGQICDCYYGWYWCFDLSVTGGLMRALYGSPFLQAFGLITGGTFTNNTYVGQYSALVLGTGIIVANGYGFNRCHLRILPGAIIRGNSYGGWASHLVVTGGTMSKNTYDLIYPAMLTGTDLAMNSGTPVYGVANDYYSSHMDSRDGVRLWRPGGVEGLKVWSYPGTILDRSGGDPDFSATHGQTYTFRFYNAEQPLLLDIPIWIESGSTGAWVVIDIKAQLENSGIAWTSVPQFDIFETGQDPLDGGTATWTENMVDNEVAQTFLMAYQAKEDTRGSFVTFRISGEGGNGTTSQYLYVAWKVSYGINGSLFRLVECGMEESGYHPVTITIESSELDPLATIFYWELRLDGDEVGTPVSDTTVVPTIEYSLLVSEHYEVRVKQWVDGSSVWSDWYEIPDCPWAGWPSPA